MRDEEKVKAKFEQIVANSMGLSKKQSAQVFIGFNSRYIEFNRKYVLNQYFNIIEKIYDHGQFYFKYFNWYMTPTAINLEELEFLQKGYTELLATTDEKKNQLIRATLDNLESVKKQIMIFKKALLKK